MAAVTHTESEGGVEQKENFWASTVTFVTNAVKLIAGAVLPIGKRN